MYADVQRDQSSRLQPAAAVISPPITAKGHAAGRQQVGSRQAGAWWQVQVQLTQSPKAYKINRWGQIHLVYQQIFEDTM